MILIKRLSHLENLYFKTYKAQIVMEKRMMVLMTNINHYEYHA